MRVPAGSSFLLATLASSSSIANLVAAAPTEATDSPATAAAVPGGVPSVPNFGSLIPNLGGLPSVPGVRRDELETRQLGSVLNTVAGLLPFLDTVLGLLGLKRGGVSAEGIPPLPQDQVDLIKGALEKLAGPLPIPAPLPINGLPGAPNGSTDTSNSTSPTSKTADNDKNDDSHVFAVDVMKREVPDGCPSTGAYAAASPSPPPGTNAPGGTAPASPLPLPVNPPNLPINPPINPPNLPNLPVSPPISPPISPPSLPVSPPSLPVNPPVSPSLPPNPPNSPAGAAPATPPTLPPLFAAAGFNYTSASTTGNYPSYPSA